MTEELDGFEVFNPHHRHGAQPQITIQRGGNFFLNAAAYEALGEPAFVTLLFHSTSRRIAFRAAQKKSAESTAVQKSSSGTIIAGRAFCRFYAIETETPHRYVATSQNGLLVIDLYGGEEVSRKTQESENYESST